MKSTLERIVFAMAIAAAALVLAPRTASADAPAQVPIQGVLTDASGIPLDGSAELTLRVYDGANAVLFTDTAMVTLDNGEFTATLGDASNPIDLTLFRDQGQLELGISVDGGTELSPRFPIHTAAYAGFAQYSGEAASVPWSGVANAPNGLADGDDDTTYSAGTGLTLSGTTFGVSANGIGAAEIASDAVGSSEIAANAVGSAEIAADAVGSSEIATSAVGSAEIASGAVGSSEIATGAVGAPEITSGAVGSSEIATGAVDTSELATDAVTASKLDHNIFTGSVIRHPLLPCFSNTDPDLDVPASTNKLCMLSYASGTGGSCGVRYLSSSDEWRLSARCSSTTNATCEMTCFQY